jgi:hypothetical protein
MHRALALLAGLLLVSQIAAQPVAAAATDDASRTTVLARGDEDDGPSRVPGAPNPGNTLTAAPMPDITVVLVSGWWVGNERHSKFRISNVGNGNGHLVHVWYQMISQNVPEDDTDNPSHKFHIVDLAPGAWEEFTVVCKPRTGFVCDKNRLNAYAHGSELTTANNAAEDDV